MPDQVVSTRYAEALLGAIEDPGLLETVHEEMQALSALVEENAQLRAFLEGPNVVEEHKHALVDNTFKGKVEQTTLDFLHLLLHKHRIDHLRGIVAEFTRLVEARRNQVRVKVTTAIELPADMSDRLKRALDASLGKDCILEPAVDSRILGGVVAVVGDEIIDGSLRAGLEELKKDLIATPLN